MYYNILFFQEFFCLHLKRYFKKKCNPKIIRGLKHLFYFSKDFKKVFDKNEIYFLIAYWVALIKKWICLIYYF